jgi:tetratricopeptide (TPR) repeat protein
MIQGGYRMNRGKGLVLALVAAVVAACASSGGGGAGTGAPDTGNSPRDNTHTNSAGVNLMQGQMTEGAEAQARYEAALQDALAAIEEGPTNPKAYLLAGQAAVGLGQWIQADSMFDRAVELYPPYGEQMESEREQGWVNAYNLGAEALNAGDTEAAVRHFEGADALYQGRPEARLALGSVYMRQGDSEAAAEAYRGALEILSGPPPEGLGEEQTAGWLNDRQVAAFNAAQLTAETGQYAEAASILQGFLEDNQGQLDAAAELRAQTALAGFLAQAGEAEQAEAMYEEILGRTDLTSAEYFQVGIGFFNTGDFARAAEAFSTAAELNPYSRDALLNLVQSRYSYAMELEETEETQERNQELISLYDDIIDAADQVRALDPLNRNLLSFMLRSMRSKAELSDEATAAELTRRTQELFREYQQQPYEVSQITVALQGGDRAEIAGTLANLSGTAGENVRLEFEILDESGGVLDSAVVTVTAPEQEATAPFSATVTVPGGELAGWRYQVLN